MGENMWDRRGWTRISCNERDEHYAIAGDALKPWSSLTDPDGAFGSPIIYTEWGRIDQDEPLLRDYRYPAGGGCEHFIYTGEGAA